MEAERGNFPHTQNAEVCSAICGILLRNLRNYSPHFSKLSREGQFSAPAKCGSLFRNLRNSSPQFAETVFRNLRRYCLLKLASATYLFQFVRVAIEFVPELHMLMGVQKSEIVRTGASLLIRIF